MTITLDHSKDTAIVNAIAAKIAALPADKPAEYGTCHALLHYTKRESEAILMATYACKRLYSWADSNVGDEDTDEDRAYRAHARELADAAIAKIGK